MKVLLAVLVFLFCASSISINAFDKKGLVLRLPFDEGSGKVAKDASGNKNDGELQGNVEWVDGEHKKAVKISDDAANNMVVVKDSNSLDVVDQISFGCWVNIEAMPDSHCSLITKADTYMIHTSNWSGKGIEQEPLLWPFDAWQTPASAPIQLNEWHHVFGVYDGKEIKTFIDGELKGRRAYTSKIAVTVNDVVVGRDSRTCCNTRRSRVIIDDVMIFSRAISDREVKEVMASTGGISVEPTDRLTTLWGHIKVEF